MKVKKILIAVMLVSSMTISLIGCSNNNDINNKKVDKNEQTEKKNEDKKKSSSKNNSKSKVDSTSKTKITNKNNVIEKSVDVRNKAVTTVGDNKMVINDNKKSGELEKSNKVSETSNNGKKESITKDVKNYIINGQGDKPAATKIKWSERFLNRVNVDSLYNQYISSGGNANDLEGFANYITINAPILDDWKDIFEKDLYGEYGEKVIKVEHLEGDLYQAYIIKDGSEIPYVVVSARTGYFHG